MRGGIHDLIARKKYGRWAFRIPASYGNSRTGKKECLLHNLLSDSPFEFFEVTFEKNLADISFSVFILKLQGASCGMPHLPLFLIIPDRDYAP
jgi:hypothetical protein